MTKHPPNSTTVVAKHAPKRESSGKASAWLEEHQVLQHPLTNTTVVLEHLLTTKHGGKESTREET
jgi:hypothetical protein